MSRDDTRSAELAREDLPARFPRYVTGAAKASLAARFRLENNAGMQDWEYEVSDPARLPEFLAAFRSGELNAEERFALMEIMIDSVNDLAWAGENWQPFWHEIAALLEAEPELHVTTMVYWASPGRDDLENCWGVTPVMRQVWDRVRPRLGL